MDAKLVRFFLTVHLCVLCVFDYLASTVSCTFPESCPPLVTVRAWLVQRYSWDPEELDLLGRNQPASRAVPLPSVPPRLIHGSVLGRNQRRNHDCLRHFNRNQFADDEFFLKLQLNLTSMTL